ncbi:putative transcriptional regulatory protein -like protein [Emericellopsis cladophorae]|uniref:Transcriptional regulatory protein -like protein n=1 Tax=Emericellopsis cladophorae TaxID=2686198 RepID=A0A9P9Y884_9HYPO|nr:putative transcriptional regulatory protein -like protein [Emericellopsis cladophorae]KAI6784883.1 putative transcriptional regulatory protein -like protein [Emericellopsis cladophorae]
MDTASHASANDDRSLTPVNTATTTTSDNDPNSHKSGYSSPSRVQKKSSTTCTTCRARKVRCNGVRPICFNCQRLGFPCSYDDDAADPAAAAAAWSAALPKRRVKQACLSCHSRKARCSGHMPACERCRAQGIECVYRPTKRARIMNKSFSAGRHSPQSHDEERDEMHDSDPGFGDPAGGGMATPNFGSGDAPPNGSAPDDSFDALIGRTFEKFFRHVHHIPMYSFLHRASLMEQYHAGNVERPLLLALIGITSCLTDMGPGMRAYGARCIDEAESLILMDYARPSTIKVQALVFMIKHRILSNRFQSAFMLLGIAGRCCAALRLNYDAPSLCFLAQESRRRLMWSIYCIDSGLSGGHRDFSLWRVERIFVGLPCNERNFEFDLPQETEQLIPEPGQPQLPHGEDVGSLALHIRIQHIRHKIAEFTKDALNNPTVRPSNLQTKVLSLHRELEDFAAHLPTSFQFSESSLRLRAYSPRICVFVMIHVWWRQCHCDLYRLGLIGLREALPHSALEKFDSSFIEHCQRQCVDHAMAMASIFQSMQKLGAKPVADLDLAICAYQCARMLKYAYHANSGNLNLSPESVMEQFNVCLQCVRDCCMGTAAAGIRADLEKLISQGLGPRITPSRPSPPPDPNRNRSSGRFPDDGASNQPVRQIPVNNGNSHRNGGYNNSNNNNANNSISNDVVMASAQDAAAANSAPQETFNVPPAQMLPMQTNMMVSPQNWGSPVGNAPSDAQQDSMPNVQHQEGPPSELNNAFEGAMDGLGLDNGLDYAMGIDVNMWTPGQNNEWQAPSGDLNMSGAGVGV